ncbi:hypothetical protein MU852_08130 [Brevundimonas albigilva]|uniref:hypothetical protein n=1 Tax=Brevundimonas albigilva TaxID=1312364 RepID=UPI00201B7391|nr:hypothetical protein [Brevundimonas albigilva]UQV19681.1 hypothetical protein MU852_08130 [Brevundimonas albigilva]
MIWFAFAPALAAGLTLQTPYGALDATPETYQPPVVRPFEPPSDFGREQAQGDSGDAAHRRALTQPVVVGAYVGSYETSPSDAETAYDQGVAQAEITMDSRAGPLDGRWRVLDAEGRPLMSLALTDLGGGRRIEGPGGGWIRASAGTTAAWPGRRGPTARPRWFRSGRARCACTRRTRAGPGSWSRAANAGP